MPEMAKPASLAPTSDGERIQIVDVLRGFALFGILLVNMEDFSSPNVSGLATLWTDRPDQIIGWVLRFAAEGKFRAVFSFLFGIGFALQLQRAQTQKGAFTRRYVRRAIVLLFIGIAHYILLWEVDILMTYAVVGLLLLPFARRSMKTSLRAAAILTGIALLLMSLIALFAQPRAGGSVSIPVEKVQMVAVYSHGSYGAVAAHRAQQLGVYFGRLIPLAPLTLMLFLVGLAAGKAGIVQEPGRHRALLWRVFIGCLVSGIVANALVVVYASQLMTLPRLARLPIVASYVLGGPTLGLAYLSGLALLLLNPVWQKRLGFLAAPGRLALTNYLLQSLVCSTLFYGYGLGWYNHVSPSQGVCLCVTIFVAQIVLSAWWLRRYRYGPAEWLWRSMTYLRLLPIRLASASD